MQVETWNGTASKSEGDETFIQLLITAWQSFLCSITKTSGSRNKQTTTRNNQNVKCRLIMYANDSLSHFRFVFLKTRSRQLTKSNRVDQNQPGLGQTCIHVWHALTPQSTCALQTLILLTRAETIIMNKLWVGFKVVFCLLTSRKTWTYT